MMRLPSVGLLLALVMCLGRAVGQNYTCKTFEEIPSADYDRSYSSIHETDKRPLGFVRETVPYNSGSKNPCYLLENVEGRQVEIMYETVPSTMLCFHNMANVTSCYDGRHQECKYATSKKATILFFCDTARGCSESAVNFWLRITVGPPPAEDSEGMWCSNRDGSEYPEDLAPLPPDFNPGSTTPVPSTANVLTSATPQSLVVTALILFQLGL